MNQPPAFKFIIHTATRVSSANGQSSRASHLLESFWGPVIRTLGQNQSSLAQQSKPSMEGPCLQPGPIPHLTHPCVIYCTGLWKVHGSSHQATSRLHHTDPGHSSACNPLWVFQNNLRGLWHGRTQRIKAGQEIGRRHIRLLRATHRPKTIPAQSKFPQHFHATMKGVEPTLCK